MSDIASTSSDNLNAELRALIASSSRQRLAGAVNAELTRSLYWSVSKQLTQEFGRGFESRKLRRIAQFAQALQQPEIVAILSRQLIWSHLVAIMAFKTPPATRSR